MFKNLLLSLLVALPVAAQADWFKYLSTNEYDLLIDPARVTVSNENLKHAEAWVKQVVHTDLTKDTLAVGDYRLVKYHFKCQSNEMAVSAYYVYKSNGSLLVSDVIHYLTYSPAVPDSNGEFLKDLVCTKTFKES